MIIKLRARGRQNVENRIEPFTSHGVARKAGDRVNESSKAFILLGFYYIRVLQVPFPQQSSAGHYNPSP